MVVNYKKMLEVLMSNNVSKNTDINSLASTANISSESFDAMRFFQQGKSDNSKPLFKGIDLETQSNIINGITALHSMFENRGADRFSTSNENMLNGFTPAQLNAMALAVGTADPLKGINSIGKYRPLSADEQEAMKHVPTLGSVSNEGRNFAYSVESIKNDFGIDLLNPSSEAFSGENPNISTSYAMILSAVSARPEDMLGILFPSIVMKHDEHRFRMVIDVANFMHHFDRERNFSGSVAAKRGSLPVIKNLFNADILEKDATRLVPYANKSSNKDILFSEPGYTWKSTHTFEDFDTGYLLPGKKIDIIGASDSDADLAKNRSDSTDQLMPTMRMVRLLVKITTTDKSDGVYVPFNIEQENGSQFYQAAQGDQQLMKMDMRSQYLSFKVGSTLGQNGQPVSLGATFDALKGYTFNFKFAIVGEAHRQDGTVRVDPILSNGQFLEVATIYDANGVQVSVESQSSVIEAITASALSGYEVLAYRANTNFKKTGQFIELRAYAVEFAVNYKNPISVLGPINAYTGDTLLDWKVLQQTITAVQAASNYAGLTAILKHADYLKGKAQLPFDENDQVRYNMANHLVNDYYEEITIDLSAMDSLTASSREKDVQQSILSKLKKVAVDMYMTSNYFIAFEELYKAEGKRPTLVLATDPLTAAYITDGWESNKIALTNFLDLMVITTAQPRMRKQVNGKQVAGYGYLTFTLQTAVGELTKPELLHFGFNPMSPVINVVIDAKPNNGGLVKQAFVIPRYEYYCVLPIMVKITFVGYSEAVGKVAIGVNIAAEAHTVNFDNAMSKSELLPKE